MTLSPIAAEPTTHGCDSAAGTTAPPSQPASRAPLLKPSERYVLIAHRLGTSVREAELIWILSNKAPLTAGALGERMGCNDVMARALIYRLRKLRSIPVKADPYIGYSLELADRERVLAAASVAAHAAMPSLGVSSQTTDRSAR